LLDANGAPVIDDFGLVRDLEAPSLTQSWAIRGPGTPFYAPPEQLNNEKDLIDWRADQFSLAVAITLITFGAHPYEKQGMSMAELVEAVATRSGPTDKFIAAAQGAHLAPLVKMVAPWPVSRYRTPALLTAAWGTP
jgi:serine/threonine protein kinase